MLFPLSDCVKNHGIKITGVLHVGAHTGEENDAYLAEGVPQSSIYWVEAIPELCTTLSHRFPNVIQAVVSDTVGPVEFKITNNLQSSSILELKTHLIEHPNIDVIRRIQTTSVKLDTLVEQYNIKADFLNMDIQGAELKCLKGFEKGLGMINAIYAEVNEKELYAGCALLPELDTWLAERGFVRVDIKMTQHGWGDALYVRKSVS
jgi:FkbM family methyltransferase